MSDTYQERIREKSPKSLTDKGSVFSGINKFVGALPSPVRRGLAAVGIILAVPLGWLNLNRTVDTATSVGHHVGNWYLGQPTSKQVVEETVENAGQGVQSVVHLADELGVPRRDLGWAAGVTGLGTAVAIGFAVNGLGQWKAAQARVQGQARADLRGIINGIRVEREPLPSGNGAKVHVTSSAPIAHARIHLAVFPDADPDTGKPGARQDYTWYVGDLAGGEERVTTMVRWRDGAVTHGEELVPLSFDQRVVKVVRGAMPNHPWSGPRVEAMGLEFDLIGGGEVKVGNRDGAIKGRTELNARKVDLAHDFGVGWGL